MIQRVAICVPTYQERENIVELLRRLREAVPAADILVGDDGSPDGTADKAQAAADDLGQIRVTNNGRKVGLGEAYRRLFAIAATEGYEVTCQMDADLSHDPAALPSLLGAIEDGADIAVGSRYVPGGSIPDWPRHRRLLSQSGNTYARRVLGLSTLDLTSAYRAYTLDALRRIDFPTTKSAGYGFQIETAYRARLNDLRVDEIPISFMDRTQGQSKLSIAVACEELVRVTGWALRDRIRGRLRSS